MRVTEMFSLKKRKTMRPKPASPEVEDAPVYHVCEDAFEYGGPRKGRADDDALRPEDRNLLLKAGVKPLPRCPECATAVGDGQRECHHCGRGLRKMLWPLTGTSESSILDR
jgi:hypothetical protein